MDGHVELEKLEMQTKFWSGNLKGRVCWGDVYWKQLSDYQLIKKDSNSYS
jgi:hypothetical protein